MSKIMQIFIQITFVCTVIWDLVFNPMNAKWGNSMDFDNIFLPPNDIYNHFGVQIIITSLWTSSVFTLRRKINLFFLLQRENTCFCYTFSLCQFLETLSELWTFQWQCCVSEFQIYQQLEFQGTTRCSF